MGALPAVGGSAISVMLIASFVWEIISLARGRYPFRMTRRDCLLAWTFSAFAALIVLTALIGQHPERAPRSLLWLVTFLVPWVLIPRLRASPGVDYLGLYILGAATGAIAAFVIAFMQLTVAGVRPEGGAGNSDVFAIMSLCLMGLGGLNAASPLGARRWLGIAAIFAGGMAVLLSLTRGVAIVALPMIALLAVYAIGARRSSLRFRTILPMLAIAVLALYAARHTLDLRWDITLTEFKLLQDGGVTSSIGERVRLWKAALEMIHNSPVWGYGIQNRMDVVASFLRLNGEFTRNYSHAHNGFLSFALDGGVPVMVALVAVLAIPVVVAWRARSDRSHRIRLFAACAVSGAYALCGMSQILFKHDIMDCFFVFFAVLVAASIPDDSAEFHPEKVNQPQM